MKEISKNTFGTNPVAVVCNYLESRFDKESKWVNDLEVKSAKFQNIGFVPVLGVAVQIFKYCSIFLKSGINDSRIADIERSVTKALWADIAIVASIIALAILSVILLKPIVAFALVMTVTLAALLISSQAIYRINLLFIIHMEKKKLEQN
jgi:hypothetical protein